MKKYVTGLLFSMALVSHSATVTWIGVEGNWLEGRNWDTGAAPAAGDDVILSKDVMVTVPNGARVQVGSVTISKGTLRVDTSANLTVNKNLTQTGGMVEVRTGKGNILIKGDYIAQRGIGRAIQGNKDSITVEGNLTASAGYRFDFNMNGSTDISRFVVKGVLTLDGELSARNFAPAGNKILLIRNTGSSPSAGVFKNIKLNTTVVNIGGKKYIYSLIDFDGDSVKNDIALVAAE